MKNENSFYSYIIQILTLAKVYKAELALNKKVESLDKIIDLSLNSLKGFEELDLLNPHQNISFKIKCLIYDDEGNILLKRGKKGEELLTFSPSLTFSLKEDLKVKLAEICEGNIEKVEILDLINALELKKEDIIDVDINLPIYLLTIKILLNSSKIKKKGYTFNKDITTLNKLDSYILRKEN